jgi:hypothetical protein
MLPPQSDHQSECVLHSLFLGCVSRGFLGFSHEGIIDFDIGAHGPPHSVSCVSMHDIIHIGSRPATTERKVIVLQADLYTRKAREERRLVRDLLRLSRALVKTLT